MSPIKTPKPKKPIDALAVLELYFKNLEEVKRWYRGASTTGRELGHIVQTEIVLAAVSVALEMALRGESWTPPEGVSP